MRLPDSNPGDQTIFFSYALKPCSVSSSVVSFFPPLLNFSNNLSSTLHHSL